MMQFKEIAEILRKRGYIDYETISHHRVFYEFDKLDFLYNECVKKFEFDYFDGNVEKIIMTQFWFGTTNFKEISTIDELKYNV